MKPLYYVYTALLALSLFPLLAVAQPARYDPNWESLNKRPLPAWYDDAKFGIFIHWGTYSVPAYAPTDVSTYAKYAEWYWKRLTDEQAEGNKAFRAFHNKMYGPTAQYEDFASQFKAELFEPDQWADILAGSGARYVVLTSKHHEGFTLWPSKYSWNWNAVDIGPHRDLAGDLTKSVRDKGLKMGFYYSLYEWFNPLYHSDLDQYVDRHMIPQMKELVTAYQPDVLWTDGEWDHPSTSWKAEPFLAWLYNESPVKDQVVVNDRWGKETRGKHGGYWTTEYGLMHDKDVSGEAMTHKWEECRGIGGSFGYNRAERLEHYLSSAELVHMLVGIVARGGNLLLNIGPTADGRIPVIMQQRLADMGSWLKINGEAIYGTRPVAGTPHEGNVRYTRKGDAVYAIALKWPGKEVSIPVGDPKGRLAVTMLGYDKPLTYRRQGRNVVVSVPQLTVDQVPSPYAFAFKVSGASL